MHLLFAIVMLYGLWLLLSPFTFGILGIASGNALLIGLVITVVGSMGMAGIAPERLAKKPTKQR